MNGGDILSLFGLGHVYERKRSWVWKASQESQPDQQLGLKSELKTENNPGVKPEIQAISCIQCNFSGK